MQGDSKNPQPFQMKIIKKKSKKSYESFHIFGKKSILVLKIIFYEDT